MPSGVTDTDNKLRRKSPKETEKQAGHDAMIRTHSQKAVERFRAEPYHFRYQRMSGEWCKTNGK